MRPYVKKFGNTPLIALKYDVRGAPESKIREIHN